MATIHGDICDEQGSSPMPHVTVKSESSRFTKLLAISRLSFLSQGMCFGLLFTPISSATAQHSTPQTPATVFRQTHSSVVLIVGAGGDEVAQGSGFIIAKNRVVTNFHVIEGLSVAYARFSDGHTEPVQGVVIADKSQDIAVLEVPTNGRSSLTFGDDITLREGDPVLALGAPRGLELTLTNGIVSAFRKSRGQFLIQNTAPIAPGSSGGPLLNSSGQVVGITSMQLTDTPGIYFSIGISQVRTLLKAAATSSQPFAQWASGKSVGAAPSLAETFAWIKGKVETKAGGVSADTSHMLAPNEFSRQEIGPIQLLQSDNECVFLLKSKRTISTRYANPGNDSEWVDTGCEEISEDTYSEVLPISYLKEAKLWVSPDGVPNVDLKFDGKKHLVHSEVSWSRRGCKDTSLNRSGTSKPVDFSDDFDLIEFFQNPTEDNEGLAKRVADAFKHTAELCAGSQPKSNEPF
jgi:S1-C subfamily serine protease